MNVLAGIRAGAYGIKAFPPDSFSGSGVGFEPCINAKNSINAALTVAGAAQVARALPSWQGCGRLIPV